ncbi:C45 family autoproteolytic acyltransferase/hydolase [Phocicoccus pinnipedialis]|uniref:Acyl-coenzyme A:6-aminopenicillanic acid acyl-transferase n=1 Tax=Phocicoccus pinnipedialis TaxID=110845 RepID=A0A6V7RCF7_9BACL|nr:C45 family autoproteolytic acyltransferase/hydolase [Jeotgalicoccus pinnipedialis]MBP1939524.1 putative choloylglycine hydrolase [Jeotgalicoccus pinnipedialis]CAD2075029.1 Acyl-coenzyme A:6-aminopenicillanic acid acyl-transferase [Jeotgalicoccus pinnipedialis]
MQNIEIRIDTFKGSHYDYGVHQGLSLKNTPYFKNRNYEWRKRRPKFDLNFNETKAIYKTFAPYIWEELLGLQDSLKISNQEMLLNLAHYRTNPRPSGCSVYVDDIHFIRNYDYHPNTYDAQIDFFNPTDGGFTSVGPVSRVTGRMDGINEHGLSMGYNFMNRKEPQDGFVCFIIGRFLLELCKDVTDAKHLLKSLPHRGGFTYIIKDAAGNHTIAETSGRSVQFREQNICTNHYINLVDENRRFLNESQERFDILDKIKNPTKEELLQAFTHKKTGLFVDNYRSWAGTIHTVYYNSNNLSMDIRVGAGEFEHLSLLDFLKGYNIQKKIASIIDTDLKFINVDWA